MCGRYFIPEADSPEELRQIIAVLNRRGTPVKLGTVLPTDTAAVIANSRRMTPAPFAMRWGIPANGRPVINARSETAAERPLFQSSLLSRRCLVPAVCYYEWDARKRRYRFTLPGEPVLWMAGLYRTDLGAPAFTILTREAAGSAAQVHSRMPVLLPPDAHAAWLDPAVPADALFRRAVTAVQTSADSPQQLSLADLM